MNLEPRWQAGILWALAGVPIVATFLQAVFAIPGLETSAVPVLGGIVGALKSVAVIAEAAVVFEQNPMLVPLLFVLVTCAWLVEGGVMFGLGNRRYAWFAAGFVTLFLFLFVGTYWSLLRASVPTVQVAGFFLVALVTVLASVGAVWRYEFDPELDTQTEEHLATARERTRSAREQFEEGVQQRVDEHTRDRLRSVAPEAVEGAEDRIESFRDECDRILDAADEIAGDAARSSRERKQEAERLASEAQSLDPDERLAGAVGTLTERLPDAIRREFADVHVVSRYGEAYELRNHVDSNSVRLPSIESAAQVGGDAHDLDDELARAVGEYSLSAVATAVADARDHIDSLESHLHDHEERFDDRIEEARDRLDSVEAEIDAIDGQPADRLRELLLEGRYESDPPPGPSAPDIEEAIERGTDCLHACDFDAAHDHAETAVETAGQLIAVAEFFRAVVETIDDEGESVPIPAAASEDLALAVRNTIERETGVTYEVADGRVRLSYADEEPSRGSVASAGSGGEPDDDTVEGSGEESGAATAGRSRQQTGETTLDPASIVDEAVYVLNELERTAEDSVAVRTVEIQTDELPSQCTAPGVLETVVEFGRRQPGVESFEVPPDAPPGYLSLTVTDEESPASVVDRIRERYLNNYSSG